MYQAISEMTTSPSLTNRIAACFATLKVPDPRTLAAASTYKFAAMPGWAAAWQAAIDTYTVNQNPDTGLRTDVITDAMILAAADVIWRADPSSPYPTDPSSPYPTSPRGGARTVAPDPTLPPDQGGPEFEVTGETLGTPTA